jgi:predicted nuclease of restriction endonuclease-like RecB superfamily
VREGSAPLTFRHASRRRQAGPEKAAVRDEVRELLAALSGMAGVTAELSSAILELPGQGLCIPDLEVTTDPGQRPVYVEILGFWSRDSVWKRIELVENGLAERIVFAVSSRLRVSEDVLGEHDSAALYVYRGKINPRALLRSVQALAGASG